MLFKKNQPTTIPIRLNFATWILTLLIIATPLFLYFLMFIYEEKKEYCLPIIYFYHSLIIIFCFLSIKRAAALYIKYLLLGMLLVYVLSFPIARELYLFSSFLVSGFIDCQLFNKCLLLD